MLPTGGVAAGTTRSPPPNTGTATSKLAMRVRFSSPAPQQMSMVRYNVSVAAKWTYERKAVNGDFVEDSGRAPNQPRRCHRLSSASRWRKS
jgi:hypothetical protein